VLEAPPVSGEVIEQGDDRIDRELHCAIPDRIELEFLSTTSG
jgi:hypothetical protein